MDDFRFIELATERYSCRKFTSQLVEDEKIELILKAASLAPTAVNFQPQRIIVVKSEEGLLKLKKGISPNLNPTLAFIVSYDKNNCWVREYDNKPSGEFDASIVATHMMLEASSIGIGSTWVMHFNPFVIKEAFNLDDDTIPVVILVMGYPDKEYSPSANHFKRKEVCEYTKYE